ncbi:hypothetical protein GALMADRAFT_224029 [Galerina marginata CBS 339.88]|uniref:Uncharacterized protein n=1 Tax=Galerina marginata (strain CBS 339.88) TaxID=685588 RepID=A0A067T6G5_GALM3|nr:hypothetical protein GALMADRAFT_224029 [Galerina marginata CBS 339.88]
MPERASSGYQWNQAAIPQLLRALDLNIQTQEAQDVKETLQELCNRRLDIQATFADQPEAVTEVQNELRETQPELYDGAAGENHLFMATQGVRYYHNQRRHRKKAAAQKVKSQRRGIAMDSMQTSKKLKARTASTAPKNKGQTKSLERPNGKRCISKPSIQASTKPKAVFKSPNSSPGGDIIVSLPRRNSILSTSASKENLGPAQRRLGVSSALAPNAGRNISSLQPHHGNSLISVRATLGPGLQLQTTLNREPAPASQETSNQGSKNGGITLVHQFLATCNPPMDRFLSNFIDFGCSSAGYLYSISTWSKEMRYLALKRMLTEAKGGPPATEMDILVIDHQFDEYF